MVNPDQINETINRAVSRGVTEMRSLLQEASSRFEGEVKKFADAVGVDERVDTDRMKNAGEQLQNVVEMIRTEAQNAAGQFSEGINDAVEEFREFVQDNVAGTGRSEDAGAAAGKTSSAAGEQAATAKKAAPKKAAAKKSTAKKAASKKAAAKKTTAKKTAKKSTAKKSTAKKATAKKSAKKATAKKPAKKAAKKSTAKKAATKKSTAKKATAKKSTAKKPAKKSTAKKAAKKSATKKK